MKLDRAFATEKLLNQKIQALETFENQKIENIITHFIEKKEKEILLSIIISWEDSTQNSLMDSFMEVGTNHKTCYTHLGDISCEIIFIREVQYKEVKKKNFISSPSN